MQQLLRGGANPNARDLQRFDMLTIAVVQNDIEMLKLALEGKAGAVMACINDFRDFVMTYAIVMNRAASPKFLFGESYGTTRAAGPFDCAAPSVIQKPRTSKAMPMRASAAQGRAA